MNINSFENKFFETNLLIIGGGAAGCLAAVEAAEIEENLKIIIAEKAHIDRSGCLASGINAINAYINSGETPEKFVEYVLNDSMGLIREDLVYSIAKKLNEVVHRVEKWGLPIKKDSKNNYCQRGRWNIEINGESIKPILADKVREKGVTILNRLCITDFVKDKYGRIIGACGFGVRDGSFYYIKADAVIVCTGGAAGIYKPNNEGSAHHKIWYCPFNTGAGYAMGIRAGAEMTTFEMRFIALRIKDILAPTGTLALGFGGKQINAMGERFMLKKFAEVGAEGAPTPLRVYGPTRELKEGRGPIFMDLTHLSAEEIKSLKKAYLNMYPELILYWAANGIEPSRDLVEIKGTEPYLVGGHAQAGYWITTNRETTLPALFAAGDVAGGAPYKFVSGCWVEGILAARSAVQYIKNNRLENNKFGFSLKSKKLRVFTPLILKKGIKPGEMEEYLQKTMDEYAGGISKYYEMNEKELLIAIKKIKELKTQIKYLNADDLHQLLNCHEVIDRVTVAEVLVEHLLYRKETRWPAYQTRSDYPEMNNKKWLKFINSRYQNGEIKIIERPYRKSIGGYTNEYQSR
ncbi:MAG: adenylyl-sulfate reductase subunit alpha [Halanaerobiales bacterium]